MSAPQGSHRTQGYQPHVPHHVHVPLQERMNFHTSSYDELHKFLNGANWNKKEDVPDMNQITHQLQSYPLWTEAKGLHYHQHGKKPALKSIMQRSDRTMLDKWKQKFKASKPDPRHGQTIADTLCDDRKLLREYYVFAGNTGSHDYALVVEKLGRWDNDNGDVVAMMLTPHPFLQTSYHSQDKLPHIVILFHTHLLAYVVLRYDPSAHDRPPHETDKVVLLPDGSS